MSHVTNRSAPAHRPAGTDAPLADGETVVLRDRKRRRYLIELAAGAQWHSHAGLVDHDELIGAAEGTAVRTSKGMEVVVLRPTRADFVIRMKRGAQVVYPKDQAMIVALADVRPGMTVVEAGAGSGALTLALLDAVGPLGRVVSYERRADHLAHAQRNVARWHGGAPDHWEVHLGDVVDHLADVTANRVVLDLLAPWEAVPAAAAAIPPGGILLAYTPTVTQVMRFREACEAQDGFADLQTSETLVREWDVAGLAVRPAHRMVAHTAFLTTARRVPAHHDGGPPRTHPAGGGPGLRWVDEATAPDAPDAAKAADADEEDGPRGG
jgi:tRNA (adenine57-N1/adenine58-N1)-methyltransferase